MARRARRVPAIRAGRHRQLEEHSGHRDDHSAHRPCFTLRRTGHGTSSCDGFSRRRRGRPVALFARGRAARRRPCRRADRNTRCSSRSVSGVDPGLSRGDRDPRARHARPRAAVRADDRAGRQDGGARPSRGGTGARVEQPGLRSGPQLDAARRGSLRAARDFSRARCGAFDGGAARSRRGAERPQPDPADERSLFCPRAVGSRGRDHALARGARRGPRACAGTRRKWNHAGDARRARGVVQRRGAECGASLGRRRIYGPIAGRRRRARHQPHPRSRLGGETLQLHGSRRRRRTD